MSDEMEETVLRAISRCWPRLDALVVLDQVTEADCGVVSERVRDRVIRLASEDPAKFVRYLEAKFPGIRTWVGPAGQRVMVP